MNRENMERWVEELESTDIPQAFAYLADEDGNHCALGICGRLLGYSALDMAGDYVARQEVYDHIFQYLGVRTSPLVYVDDAHRSVFVDVANDKYKLPFWHIAQLLRTEYLKDEG